MLIVIRPKKRKPGLPTLYAPTSTAHIRPHDIEIEKTPGDQGHYLVLKDWQHLGASIRIELVNKKSSRSDPAVFAKMPSEQFKRLHLVKGDKVSLKIRNAHWFQ